MTEYRRRGAAGVPAWVLGATRMAAAARPLRPQGIWTGPVARALKLDIPPADIFLELEYSIYLTTGTRSISLEYSDIYLEYHMSTHWAIMISESRYMCLTYSKFFPSHFKFMSGILRIFFPSHLVILRLP